MKKIVVMLLAVLMLAGCAKQPATTATTVPTETQAATEQTEPTETTAPVVLLPEVETPVPVVNTVTINEAGLTDEEILAQRRDIVEAEMRNMMGMLWTPAKDITYKSGEEYRTLKAGRIYRGMPYSHGAGSGYSWMMFAKGEDENGVYTFDIDGKYLTSGDGHVAIISNDCADALFWSWAQVSSTIDFTLTQNMSTFTGCIKVGDYKWDDMGKFDGSTKPIVQENGEQTMFKAYAQMQKGDGMVLYTKSSGGHAVMVCESVVVMDGDKIDGEKSYVRILEQISSSLDAEETYYEAQVDKTCYKACGYDSIWTYNTIYKKGYLPVTCKELIDPAPLAEQKAEDSVTEHTEKTMFRGQVTSNYRISHATYTIYDAEDRAVQQMTCFGMDDTMFVMDLYRFNDFTELDRAQGFLDLDSLPAGTYKCVLTCQISTGSVFEVRNFEITK